MQRKSGAWISCHFDMNYTYVLKCADNSLYTGWTNNLTKRLKAHNEGKASKYTRSRLPVELVYFEEHEDRNEARKREVAIKRLSTAEKRKLIANVSFPSEPA